MAANANLIARPPVTERFVTIQQTQRFQKNWTTPSNLRTEPPLYPWLKLAGRWIRARRVHSRPARQNQR